MTEENGMNIPVMTVEDAKKNLLKMYSGAFEKEIMLKKLPTPFFWGPPGVGKTESVFQLANELETLTNRTVTVTDVRLLLFSPVDLRGVPVADKAKEFTNWLKPKIFDMNSSTDYINILFLDELSAAPQSVQAAAYQICLDRKIGEHTLPENCIVIAAGNRTTDNSVSYKMPKALCNRLLHICIKSDYEAWRNWAVNSGISDKIIAYLAYDSTQLCVSPENSDTAYPTPRSWAFVSTLLEATGDSPADAHSLIAGCIGESNAIEFETFCKGIAVLPPVESIIDGICTEYPNRHDVLFALVSKLAETLRLRSEEITAQQLENVCAYVMHFPGDFVMSFMKDLSQIASLRKKLMRCAGFQKWISKNKDIM